MSLTEPIGPPSAPSRRSNVTSLPSAAENEAFGKVGLVGVVVAVMWIALEGTRQGANVAIIHEGICSKSTLIFRILILCQRRHKRQRIRTSPLRTMISP